MKIAHLTATFPPYWGGTGNVAYHNARILHQRGHKVVVFTAATGKDGEFSTPFEVRRLRAPLRVGNAPWTPGLLRELRGFDIVHLHYPYIFGAELAAFATRAQGIPMVLTYHNRLEEARPIKRALFALYNRLAEPAIIRRAARILAVRLSHFTSLFPELREDPRLLELPNGVEASIFHPVSATRFRQAVGTPVKAPVALFVGALDQAHRSKNLEGLIGAFKDADLRGAELWVVGGGGLRSRYEALAKARGLNGKVRFLGRRPPTEALAEIYGAATVTVLPSSSLESFGMVLLESMACGTPIITTNLPGVRDLVRDGVNGLLVPPGDAGALARALTRMLVDPVHARKMGEEGSRDAGSYAWEVVGARLEEIYIKLLAGRSATVEQGRLS